MDAEPIMNGSATGTPDRERKARLYIEHPDECPEITVTLPYLIHPPSKLAPTSSWQDFRDNTLLPMIRHSPNDPNLPNFLRQAERILVWRAAVPPENRFWKK